MRISIRIKFFVVLLAFSLGPIFISRGIMGRAAEKMAVDVSDQAREELQEIVSTELEHNAVSLLKILEGGAHAMKLGVRMIALEAGHLLDGRLPDAASRPHYTIDFADPDFAPSDATFAKGYDRQTMSGKTRPIKVSFDNAVFHLPRGVREGDVIGQMQRLQQMLPTFKAVYEDMKTAPYWFNVGLESGAFMTYPGHGNFPMMYDHRSQHWYKLAIQRDECAWDTPVVDPATRTAMAVVSYPIKSENGKFLGSASIDIPVSAMLDESELKSRWKGDIRSFMVMRAPGDEPANDGLLILAQQAYEEGGRRHWMTGIEQEWLVSEDADSFKKLLQSMTEKDSGVAYLPYKGEASVWAFASNPDYSFMLIAPQAVIAKLPDAVADSLSDLFIEMRDVSAIISGVMLIITGFIAWFGSRTITRPLVVMAGAARRLASGDFSARMTTRTGDERDDLIDSFNDMGPKLEELLLISKDLELAQEVQKLLLPRAEPQLSGYDISGGIDYCDQTGGDYYDFINVSCESGCSLAVVLGDVSGHGVPSSLVMASARSQLHSLSQIVMAPEVRIGAINTLLSTDLDGTGRFLTMFYLQLEEGSGAVRWVRAGHDPAIRYTPATDEFGELGGDGLALGVLADFQFEGYEDTLKSGEILTLATDGVWEARGSDGEMFGKQRMLAIIRDNAHKSAEGIRKAIMASVSEYQSNGQEDDIAVVVVKKA